LALRATEFYDVTSKSWIEWQDYDQSITAYLVLLGGDGKLTKNYDSVKEVFKWDGQDIEALNNTDYNTVLIQFSCASETYEGKSRRKVTWIDPADADPNRAAGVKKLDTGAFAALKSKFGQAVKANGGTTAPAAAKPLPKPSSRPLPLPTPAPKAAAAPLPPPPTTSAPAPAEKSTVEAVWAKFQELNADKSNEAQTTEFWAKVQERFKTTDTDAITGEQWYAMLLDLTIPY
jgi:hypothetical protein